jgi:hypothetical protein
MHRPFIRRGHALALTSTLAIASCTITTRSRPPQSADAPAEREKPKEKAEPEKKPEPEKQVEKKSEPEKKPEKKAEKKAKPEPKPKPEEKKPEPVVEEPVTQTDRSKIVLPVKVAFDTLVQELEAQVPKTDAKDWTQVTQGEESPKAELKYELWRDAMTIKLEDHRLHVTVPVRYAATIRAQVKNPLTKKWFWIAKGETWGTKQEPQRLTAHFEVKLGVEDDWSVSSEVKLVKLEHGDPPSGKICKNVGIDVCVEKSSIAPKVRAGIDDRLEPKLRKALAKIEGKIEKTFDLKKRAERMWRAMQAPQALPGAKDTWLVLNPSAAGVGRPELDGSDVRVDLALEGRLRVESGAKPKVEKVALPKVSKVSGPSGFHVVATLRIPTDAMSGTLEKQLKGMRLTAKKDGPVVAGAKVVASADDKHPRRITVKVALGDKPEDEVELQGELAYDAKAQRLSVKDFAFGAGSESRVAKIAGLDPKAVRKAVSERARWDLSDASEPLKKAITAALSASLRGEIELSGALEGFDVRDLKLTQEGLEAEVIVSGRLGVTIR